MLDSDANTRIYNEAIRGIAHDARDTPEEAAYRARLVAWARDLRAAGKAPEPIFELPDPDPDPTPRPSAPPVR